MFKKLLKTILVPSLLTILTISAFSQEKKEEKKPVKIEGIVFADYRYDLTDGKKNINSFEVSRVYLTAKKEVSEYAKLRITLEIDTTKRFEDSADDKLKDGGIPFLKYAYLELPKIIKDNKIYFGLVEMPWIGYEEKIWGNRFVSKVFPDLIGKIKSADRGIEISGKKSGENFGIDYALAIVNGEGVTGEERNKYKDFQARISFQPAKKTIEGLKIHSLLSLGNSDKDKKRDRNLFGLSMEDKAYHAMFSYLNTKDDKTKGKGYSVHSSYKLNERNSIFARLDDFDPDDAKADDGYKIIILGCSYKVTDGVRASLDYQTKNYEDATKKDEKKVYLHLEVKY